MVDLLALLLLCAFIVTFILIVHAYIHTYIIYIHTCICLQASHVYVVMSFSLLFGRGLAGLTEHFGREGIVGLAFVSEFS